MGTSPFFIDRKEFVKLTLGRMNCHYIWGAKGQERVYSGQKLQVFDCSGLVTWALWKLSQEKWDQRQRMNTDRLWDYFPETSSPEPGDLVLYGPKGDPNHVMIWLGFADMVYGACGGGSATTLPSASAKVQLRSSHLYRPDLLGYRKLEHP